MYARGNPARWWRGRRIGRGTPAPLGMFISPTRRVASFTALAGLAGVIGGAWYLTNPARISELSQVLLSNVLGGKVTVASGHLSWSGTLLLQGVELRTPGEAGKAGMPVFAAEQIEARFDWASLLEGRLRATQLTAVRPTLYMVEDRETGHWNYEELRKSPAETKPADKSKEAGPVALPVILLRDAQVQWAEVSKGEMRNTGLTVVEGRLTPVGVGLSEGVPGTLYTFELAQHAGVEGVGGATPGATVSGSWDVATHRFVAVTEGLELTESLKTSMPRQVREFWDAHRLHGKVGRMQVGFDETGGMELTVDLDRVSLVQPLTPETGLAAGTTFPLEVEDLSGTVVVGVAKGEVEVRGLRGAVMGHRFEASGRLAVEGKDVGASPFEVTVRLPGLDLGMKYPPLLMAFEPAQDALERVHPHGPMDVRVTARRGSAGAPVTIDGLIECHDAGLQFAHFPYPLTHMNGNIRFDEKLVRFEQVTALAGEDLVLIDGSAGTYEKNPAIDFTVSAKDATFDERMAACLPEKYQGIWDQFAVRGRGSLYCRVTHERANPEPPKIVVEVGVTEGSGYMRAMPYPFTGARGKLVFGSEETRVEKMVLRGGLDGSGVVTLDGVVRHPRGDVDNLRPELTVAASVPIDSALLHAMPEEYTDKLAGAELGGRLAFDGNYRRVADDAAGGMKAEITGALSVMGGRYARKGNGLEITGIGGEAMLEPGGVVAVRSAGGRMAGLGVMATGEVNLEKGTGALDVGVVQAGYALPAMLPGMVPAAAQEMWKQYGPAGQVDVDASAKVTVGEGTFALQDYLVKVAAKGVAVHNGAWPEAVEEITGQVTATPGKVVMRGMGARTGPVHATWEGEYVLGTGACVVSGAATSEGLPGKWVTLLPDGLQNFLTTYKAGGTFHAGVTKLERAGTGKEWQFAGTLGATGLTLEGAIPVKVDEGAVTLEGTWGTEGAQKGVSMNGTLSSSGVRFTGKVVDSVTAKVTLDPKEKRLRVEDMDGKVAGGRLQGSVVGSFDGGGRYEANLVMADAELARLLLPETATAEERAKIGTGRVTATLAVQQTFGAGGERTGRGELQVKDGVLYNVPLAMGLMQVATLRLPVARSFDGASMTYYLRDDRVTFEKILLESKGINLAGAGTLSLEKRGLDLTFVTESPNDWNLPILSPILKQTRRELLQLSVTGTVDNPKVTPVPLSGITTTLRNLLPIPRGEK